MLTRGQLTTAALMLSAAIGIGHVTEYWIADAQRVSMPEPRPAAQKVQGMSLAAAPLLMGDGTALQITKVSAPEILQTPAEMLSGMAKNPGTSMPDTRKAASGAASCSTMFDAARSEGAVAHLTLEAPCAPESRVDIIHSGFRIVEQTDAAGRLDIRVPALTQDARFTAVFPASARRFTAQVNIPEVAGYDRVALQASEPGPLGIEALTNGTTPISAIASVEAEGSESAFGYLLRLGRPEGSDIGQLDIFSFPRENTQSLGVVRLNVRADVTTDTCGREIPAIAAQTRHGGAHRQVQVDIALPGCDAVGDTLVLKNILQDLKLASN